MSALTARLSAWSRRLGLLAVSIVAALLLVPTGPAAATPGVDDYPYSGGPIDSVDQWNFYTRECTSFVAWRINNDRGIAFHNYYAGVHWGNALNWDDAAGAAGISTDGNPTAGSVAVFNPGVDGVGSYGHVAYVLQVGDGQVLVEDYNWSPYNYGQRWMNSAGVNFIHF